MQFWEDNEVKDVKWRPDPKQLKKIPQFIFGFIVALFVLIALVSTFYTVSQDEMGVVTRFGKFNRVSKPGLHFKMPFFIEGVQKPKVQRIFKEEFGFRTTKPGVRSVYSDKEYRDEALMLCGDLNTAMVEWIVQYKVKDPVAFLFNVRDVRKTIRDVSEGVLRKITGDSSVDEVLTMRRIEINKDAEILMQKMLDTYNSGIQVVTVKLQDVNPPEEVKPAFNEVNESKQDRERFINEAWQDYNKEVPKAKGEAKKMLEIAAAYAIERVNTAKGEAKRFELIYDEYNKAKDVTRRRIYLETMKDILLKIGKKFILDESGTGVLPLLPLEQTSEGGAK